MQNEKEEKGHKVGEMKKHPVIMEDNRRYLIFYTFEKAAGDDSKNEEKSREENENV